MSLSLSLSVFVSLADLRRTRGARASLVGAAAAENNVAGPAAANNGGRLLLREHRLTYPIISPVIA